MASDKSKENPEPEYLGPWTEASGLTTAVLKACVHQKYESVTKRVDVVRDPSLCRNGLILELVKFQQNEDYHDEALHGLILSIFPPDSDKPEISVTALRLKIRRLKEAKTRAQKAGKRSPEGVASFLDAAFNLAVEATPVSRRSRTSSSTSTVTDQATQEANVSLAAEVSSLATKNQQLQQTLSTQRSKLRNVKKTLKRRESTVTELEEEVEEVAAGAKEKRESTLSVHRKREHRLRTTVGETSSRVSDLEAELRHLRSTLSLEKDKNLILQAEVDELKEEAERTTDFVPTMSGGKYLAEVRQCCMELLSANVGIFNVGRVIRSFLDWPVFAH